MSRRSKKLNAEKLFGMVVLGIIVYLHAPSTVATVATVPTVPTTGPHPPSFLEVVTTVGGHALRTFGPIIEIAVVGAAILGAIALFNVWRRYC